MREKEAVRRYKMMRSATYSSTVPHHLTHGYQMEGVTKEKKGDKSGEEVKEKAEDGKEEKEKEKEKEERGDDDDIPCRVTVVGDDDQSIYSFRGATPSVFSRFKHDYPTFVFFLLSLLKF